MEILSRGNGFQATQWLKNPHKELDNKSPAQLIQEEKVEIVFEILQVDFNKKSPKKPS